MSIQDVLKFIEGFKGNAAAGFTVFIYYLLVYWPKIRDGLGLSLGKKLDLERIEKNYQLFKLRIEVEQIKKSSGLEPETIQKLENEMLERLTVKKGKPFTPVQKFVAVPMLILTTIIVFMSFKSPPKDAETTPIDTLVGGVFIAIITIIGFWGIPLLQRATNGFLKKLGFITFWSFGLYIISYMIIYILVGLFSNGKELTEENGGKIFLLAVIISLILGLFEKLPLMKTTTLANP